MIATEGARIVCELADRRIEDEPEAEGKTCDRDGAEAHAGAVRLDLCPYQTNSVSTSLD